MGWVWYRLGQVKTNRLVADDGSTDVDVEGMDASEGQFPPPVAPKSPSQRGTDLAHIIHEASATSADTRL